MHEIESPQSYETTDVKRNNNTKTYELYSGSCTLKDACFQLLGFLSSNLFIIALDEKSHLAQGQPLPRASHILWLTDMEDYYESIQASYLSIGLTGIFFETTSQPGISCSIVLSFIFSLINILHANFHLRV